MDLVTIAKAAGIPSHLRQAVKAGDPVRVKDPALQQRIYAYQAGRQASSVQSEANQARAVSVRQAKQAHVDRHTGSVFGVLGRKTRVLEDKPLVRKLLARRKEPRIPVSDRMKHARDEHYQFAREGRESSAYNLETARLGDARSLVEADRGRQFRTAGRLGEQLRLPNAPGSTRGLTRR